MRDYLSWWLIWRMAVRVVVGGRPGGLGKGKWNSICSLSSTTTEEAAVAVHYKAITELGGGPFHCRPDHTMMTVAYFEGDIFSGAAVLLQGCNTKGLRLSVSLSTVWHSGSSGRLESQNTWCDSLLCHDSYLGDPGPVTVPQPHLTHRIVAMRLKWEMVWYAVLDPHRKRGP